MSGEAVHVDEPPRPVIPTLPAPYVEHLVSPRGVGDVTLAQAAGEVGSMVGGGGVRVTLAWREGARGQAVIGEALARVFGSHALVAPASALTERVIGLDAEDAAALTPEDLVGLLTGPSPDAPPLPAMVARACEPVVEAWHRALGTPGRGRPSDPLGMGVLVCRCLGVGDRQVRQAIRQGARDPEAVGDRCRAGTGCRSCRPDIWTLIDEETAPEPGAPTASLPPVARIVWARGGPLLRSLGMRLTDVRVENGSVAVAAEPARARPDLSGMGVVAVLRHLLRETVSPHVTVTWVNGLARG
jgi:bacterioferritin-associated ferredoxin